MMHEAHAAPCKKTGSHWGVSTSSLNFFISKRYFSTRKVIDMTYDCCSEGQSKRFGDVLSKCHNCLNWGTSKNIEQPLAVNQGGHCPTLMYSLFSMWMFSVRQVSYQIGRLEENFASRNWKITAFLQESWSFWLWNALYLTNVWLYHIHLYMTDRKSNPLLMSWIPCDWTTAHHKITEITDLT